MKRLGWKITGILTGMLIVGSGIALVAHETSSDGTQETSNGIPYEPQILKYGLQNLSILKRELPNLYTAVISPQWMEMEGTDKLKLVVKSVPNVWGASDEEVDEYLSRIDQYESNVPDGEKENVGLIFGLVGDHLLRQVFYIEQHKGGTEALVDAYSIVWEDDDPSKLVEYEKCLNRTIETMGTNTKSAFMDWLDGIEKIASGKDMFLSHASLQSDTATEFVNLVSTEPLEAQQKCNPDWETDS